MKHSVKRLGDGNFLYRGKVFSIRDSVPNGYYGRYSQGKMWFSYQWQVKEYIDNLCNESNVETFMTPEQVKETIEFYKEI